MDIRSSAPAAISYEADAYDPGYRMMGRHVAGEAFLQALARYEPMRELAVYAAAEAHL